MPSKFRAAFVESSEQFGRRELQDEIHFCPCIPPLGTELLLAHPGKDQFSNANGQICFDIL